MSTQSFNNKTELFISASAKPGNFGTSVYNKLFQNHNLNAVYLARSLQNPRDLADSIRTLNIRGCSVSMPFKSEIIPHLDSVDSVVQRSNSANTIRNENGKLLGFNTDFYGIQKVLEQLDFKSALIYGTGSVADSAALVLKEMKIDSIFVSGRSKDKAKLFSEKWKVEQANSFPEIDLLINATPASQESVDHPIFQMVQNAKTLFDFVISPNHTALVEFALNLRKEVVPGISMCKFQLQKQFGIYFGFEPQIKELDEVISEHYLRNN